MTKYKSREEIQKEERVKIKRKEMEERKEKSEKAKIRQTNIDEMVEAIKKKLFEPDFIKYLAEYCEYADEFVKKIENAINLNEKYNHAKREDKEKDYSYWPNQRKLEILLFRYEEHDKVRYINPKWCGLKGEDGIEEAFSNRFENYCKHRTPYSFYDNKGSMIEILTINEKKAGTDWRGEKWTDRIYIAASNTNENSPLEIICVRDYMSWEPSWEGSETHFSNRYVSKVNLRKLAETLLDEYHSPAIIAFIKSKAVKDIKDFYRMTVEAITLEGIQLK